MAKRKTESPVAATPGSPEYTVVARRYRPQQFADLVGQEPVAQALVNALQSNRVAHAYLFTGVRGVGKTSAARILAKALNCEKGPTATPCDQCENCLAIAAGQDVDVQEIDGASNNSVDDVRELRQVAQFRPTRSRYRIFIIDEVHMLAASSQKSAFNALLKVLEEPPPHVKFIFATTEVQKIPLTILSRCQRFDFAGIPGDRIAQHLRAVVAGEGREADDDALELVARRAGGSMRDAQSLLDQLLAFGGDRLTAEQIHKLLGTAPDDVIAGLAAAVLGKDVPQALALLDAGLSRGLQPGELVDQLIDYWRDLMLIGSAGADVVGLSSSPRLREALITQAAATPLDSILAALDVLQTTRSRFRGSTHNRVLLEMAVVRMSRLDDLISLSQLAQMVQSDPPSIQPPRPTGLPLPAAARPVELSEAAKKKPVGTPDDAIATALTAETLPQIWSEVLTQVGPFLGRELDRAGVPAISGPNRLVLHFPPAYNRQCEFCSDPARLNRVLDALERLTGQTWDLRLEVAAGRNGQAQPTAAATARPPDLKDPLVQSVIDLLGAKLLQVDDGFGQVALVAEDAEDLAPDSEEI